MQRIYVKNHEKESQSIKKDELKYRTFIQKYCEI